MKPAWCEQLDAYLGGELAGERRAEFEAHLRACASCRREAEEFEGLAALLARAASAERGPERLARGIRQEFGRVRRRARLRVLAVSAAALVVGVLGWVWSGGWRPAVDAGRQEGVPLAGPREQHREIEAAAVPQEQRDEPPGSPVVDRMVVEPPSVSAVRAEFPGDMIAVPIESDDASATIYWLYPASYVAAGGD